MVRRINGKNNHANYLATSQILLRLKESRNSRNMLARVAEMRTKMDAYVLSDGSTDEVTLKLDLNESPFPLPEGVRKAVSLSDNDVTRYPSLTTDADLHAAIREYAGANNVFLTQGSDDALRLCLRVALEPPQQLLVFVPTYNHILVLANLAGIPIQTSPVTTDISSVSLLLKASPNIGAVYLCTPNNPTGEVWAADDVAELTRRHRGITFIVDEAYVEYGGESNMALAENGNVLITRTFSKAFGLAALRIGYVAAPREVIDLFKTIYSQKAVSTVAKRTALECLTGSLSKYRLNIIEAQASKRALALSLKCLSGVEQTHYGGGNFLLVQTVFSDMQKLLLSHDVAVRDRGSITGLERNVRITAGSQEQMGVVYDAFAKVLAPRNKSKYLTGIILAAGLGSRMNSDKPKCLMTICGQPMLYHTIDQLRAVGVKDIVVVTGFKAPMIARAVRGMEDVRCVENRDYAKYNNWRSLAQGLDAVSGSTYVVDGDLMFPPCVLQRLAKCGDKSTAVVDGSVSYTNEAMRIKVNSAGIITRMAKGLPEDETYGEYIGLLKISGKDRSKVRNLLSRCSADKYYDEAIVHSGDIFRALDTFGASWVEFDTQEEFELAQALRKRY